MPRIGLVWKGMLVLGLCASQAWAGGFTIPIIGSRMIGRLNFTAKADDTTAIYHNPAGLTQIKGYRIDGSATSIYSHTYYRVEHPDGTFSAPIKFENPWGMLPYFGFSGDFGFEKLRFGIALYSPHNTAASLPPDSEAKFQLIEGKIITVFLTPTVAYQLTDTLSLGMGLSAVYGMVSLERWNDLSNLVTLPLNPAVKALLTLDANDVSWGADFGALWKPNDWLACALTYNSPTNLSFSGDLDADGYLEYSSGTQIDLVGSANASADLTLPQMVRVGFNFQITPKLDVGIDGYWQDYSVYDKLEVKLTDLEMGIGGGAPGSVPDSTTVEPKLSKDIYAFGVGGTYKITDDIDASAGYFYDQSPYPNKTYTILSPDADKHGLAIGLGYRYKQFAVHGSYLRLFYKDRDVHDSILNPPANGNVHGKFTTIFGLQGSYTF